MGASIRISSKGHWFDKTTWKSKQNKDFFFQRLKHQSSRKDNNWKQMNKQRIPSIIRLDGLELRRHCESESGTTNGTSFYFVQSKLFLKLNYCERGFQSNGPKKAKAWNEFLKRKHSKATSTSNNIEESKISNPRIPLMQVGT